MVGNDIVDLEEAIKLSNWQHPRFLDKLFTDIEQQYIKTSLDPFIAIWKLWSMKEAAYKIYVQINPGRFYNPKRFICNLTGERNSVTYLDFRCFVKTNVTSKFILSEARLSDSNTTLQPIRFNNKSYSAQSKNTYSYLLDSIAKDYNLSRSNLQIKKNKYGVPKIYYNLNVLSLSISITHHGNYGAYAVNTYL